MDSISGGIGTDDLARVIEASGDALVVLDSQWRYAYVNGPAEAVIGKPSADLLGRAVTEVFPGFEGTPFWAVYQRAVREQVFLTVEEFFEPLGKWFHVRAVPLGEMLYLHFRDVTIQRQAEERSRVFEERERTRLIDIFMQAPAFIGVVRGPTHVFEMVNPPYLQLVGHRGDLIGRPVAEAIPEVVEQGFIGLLDRVYTTGEPFVGTDVPILLQRTPDGPLEQCFVDFTYQPLRDTDGNVSGILAHGIDLTERKRAEDALRLSEERYRTLVESTDVGFCVIEVLFDEQDRYRPVDYRFLEANPAFERHTGLVGAVGSTMKGLVPDMDGFWFETYGRVVTTGEATRFENHAPAMGRWFDVYALRVGEPEERKVAVLFTDITARKEAEKTLQDQGEYLRRLIESSPDCIKTLDLDGTIQSISPHGMGLLEIEDAATVVGKRWDAFFTDHPQTVSAYRAALHTARAGGTARFEGFCPTATGAPRWWDVAISPITGADGSVEMLLSVSRDITERVRSEEALLDTAERLRESQEHLELAFESVHLGMWEVDLRTGEQVWSGEQERLFGLERGSFGGNIDSFFDLVHPEDRERVLEHARRCFADPNTTEYEAEFRVVQPATDGVRWLYGRARIERDPATGEALRVTGVNLDITERVERERRERFLAELAERAGALTDPEAVIADSVRSVGEFLGLSRCTFADIDAEADTCTIHLDYCADGVPSIAGALPWSSFGPAVNQELAAGRAVVVEDTYADPERVPPEFIPAYDGIGVRAHVTVPAFHAERLVSVISAQSAAPRCWPPEEVELLLAVAERTSLTVQIARQQRTLGQAEERLRLAAEATGVGTFDFHPVSGELRWDERCKALWGLPPDAPVDYSVFLSGLHPDDRERTDAAVQGVLDPEGSAGGEYEIEFRTVGIADGGAERWILAQGRAFFDAERTRAERFVGTVIDISARKEAERRQALFAALAQHSTDFIGVADMKGAPFFVNEAGLRLVGLDSFEQALRVEVKDFFFPEDQPFIYDEFFPRVLAEGHGEVEVRFRHFKTGEPTWVNYAVFAVPDPDTGKSVALATVSRNISERKALEAERAAIAAKNARIAETLQSAMLLAPPEDAFSGLSVGTHYEPAWDEALIGGDFYDALQLDDGRVALICGDGTGKGLEAARYVSESLFVLRAYLRESPDPALALTRLNNYMVDGQRFDGRSENALAAVAVVVIDTHTGEARFAAGGAEPPLVVRADTARAEQVDVSGVVLGANPKTDYDSVSVNLNPGDLIVMSTDGTTEARNRQTRQFFGYEGLLHAAEGTSFAVGSLNDTARLLVERAKEFAGGRLGDDACVVVARFVTNPSATDDKFIPQGSKLGRLGRTE